ncbi:sulfate transporter [Mycobacterium sp. 663a-19]|uniref:STAS domain-containing protein n=1 Tax=Mycobacterium sp. 663a-19 TaxID=2986148 RepID=UPI002D1F391D|nr:STAS domain-containing protein [Mycobacterium sp. 663a-19]MEB3982122.1 sulfate transporter [Mycobacterium sp. 663a-19]
MTDIGPSIHVAVERRHDVTFVTVTGELDASTYRGLRDAIIKAALDEPRAVIVDVNQLFVPSDSAWSVFTSARWHVSTWPDVPILLVCEPGRSLRAITARGVSRYVPVYPTRGCALDAANDRSLPIRRRARAQLSDTRVSVGLARAMVTDWLTKWDKGELIPTATTVATVFVENVLEHTDSTPALIVENYDDTVTVAVEDDSDRQPALHEDPDRGADIVSGLAIVAALCRVWGSTPTSSGKTVWALVGRENRL